LCSSRACCIGRYNPYVSRQSPAVALRLLWFRLSRSRPGSRDCQSCLPDAVDDERGPPPTAAGPAAGSSLRPLHARAPSAPTPNPTPLARWGAVGRTFLACRRAPESHLRFRSPTVLSRRASVRGGRCGAANGPFSSLDTARTVRIDASFDRLASCGNPRFGALEHACGQSRGDDLLLPIQPAGVLLEYYQL